MRSTVHASTLNPVQLSLLLLFHGLTLYLLTRVPWSGPALYKGLVLAFCMHQLRFFGMSVVLHRYFAHKAFRTSRVFQFVLAIIGSLTLIRGPIRFAAAHRYHHRHSDQPEDIHSPRDGFWWAYVGWLMSRRFGEISGTGAKDLRRFVELRVLDRLYWLPSVLLGIAFYVWGGLPALVWGSLVSTLSTWHLAFWITSVFHRVGRQDFDTGDDSRNHGGLALLTFGEGWHNNHHHHMQSAQLSAHPGQIDPGFWSIWCLEKLGLIHNVKRFRT